MSLALVMKSIKPKKLKDGTLRLELLNGMRRAQTKIKRDFESTTRTWDRDVKFEGVVSIGKNGPQLLVGTDDPIYRYVSEGTKPHIIRPVKAKALRFQGGYRAKTSPGIIGSTSGGKFGKVKFRQYVRHPGTQPRNFGAVIARKWRRPFRREMEASMKRAASKSRHRIK